MILDDRAYADLLAAVNALPGLFVDLEDSLPAGGQSDGEPVARGRSHPLPFRDDVAEAKVQLEAVVVGWCRVISEEQMIGLPSATVIQASDYLALHLLWAAEQMWADEFCREVLEGVSAARRALSDRVPMVTLGQCPETGEDGAQCPGELRVRVDESSIRCRHCGTTWAADEWARLALLMGCDDSGLVDAYAASYRLADLGYRITPSTIRSWKQLGKIEAKGRERRRDLFELSELIERARLA